ncbi:hypothetical protein K8I61_13955 [bacterium]|nr:hypothetical protein [bacterium]
MTHPNPIFEYLFAARESAYGVVAEPEWTGAFSHLRASFTPSQERADREDRHGSRGVAERVSRRRRVAWEIDAYLLAGGAGLVPALDPVFEALGLASSVSQQTSVGAGFSPTDSACLLANASAAPAGSFAGFMNAGELHLRRVADNENGVVTLASPLPFVSQIGDTVYPAIAYRPTARPSASYTLWRYLDGLAFAYPGCVGEMLEVSVSGSREARARVTGLGADEIFAATNALAGGVDAVTSEFPVTRPDAIEPGAILRIDDEIVRVTETTDDAIVVTRGHAGTAPAAHAEGAIVYPPMPAHAPAGRPVAGIAGRVAIGGETFHVTEASLELREGVRLREVYGRATPSGFAHPGRRRASLSLTGFLADDTAARHVAAKNFSPLSVEVQAGVSPGGTIALFVPRFEPSIPEFASEPGKEVPLTLDGACLESDGDDEVYLVFA